MVLSWVVLHGARSYSSAYHAYRALEFPNDSGVLKLYKELTGISDGALNNRAKYLNLGFRRKGSADGCKCTWHIYLRDTIQKEHPIGNNLLTTSYRFPILNSSAGN